MSRKYRIRIVLTLLVVLLVGAGAISQSDITLPWQSATATTTTEENSATLDKLNALPVKGRAPKTGYARSQFGGGWREVDGCSTREIVLARDLVNVIEKNCQVLSGTLNDPYSGKTIEFTRGPVSSQKVQIDHVVALSDAWQTGAQQLSFSVREDMANDPLELLAVDGSVNQKKSDGDAATWLPPNKSFRCQYVSRQIDVKTKYRLWVTQAEEQAMRRVLSSC